MKKSELKWSGILVLIFIEQMAEKCSRIHLRRRERFTDSKIFFFFSLSYLTFDIFFKELEKKQTYRRQLFFAQRIKRALVNLTRFSRTSFFKRAHNISRQRMKEFKEFLVYLFAYFTISLILKTIKKIRVLTTEKLK